MIALPVMRRALTGIAFLLIVFGRAAVADAEAEVYESIAQINVGPVFLTPAERRLLDLQRLTAASAETAPASAEPADTADESEPERQASGYIISSTGLRSEWSGNDFVPTREPAPARRRFPGDVPVVRHRAAAPDETSDGRNDHD